MLLVGEKKRNLLTGLRLKILNWWLFSWGWRENKLMCPWRWREIPSKTPHSERCGGSRQDQGRWVEWRLCPVTKQLQEKVRNNSPGLEFQEKTLMLGKTEGGRRRGRQRMRRLDGITDSMNMSLSKLQLGVGDGQRSLACCSPWGHKESDTTEGLSWTEFL